MVGEVMRVRLEVEREDKETVHGSRGKWQAEEKRMDAPREAREDVTTKANAWQGHGVALLPDLPEAWCLKFYTCVLSINKQK